MMWILIVKKIPGPELNPSPPLTNLLWTLPMAGVASLRSLGVPPSRAAVFERADIVMAASGTAKKSGTARSPAGKDTRSHNRLVNIQLPEPCIVGSELTT